MLDTIFLILFSGSFFLWNLGGTYLTNWDEAWYAGISKNMLLRGDFITPFWNNAPYFDKGPLYHWLSVLTFKIIPHWEIAARLPSALAGIGCVVLVYLLGKILFNRKTGIISSLVLGSTIGFLYRTRTGNLDAMVVFLILASFLFFFFAQKNPKYFLLLGFSLGLLFLTKTALVVLPLFTFLLFIIWERDLKFYKNYYLVLGMALGLLIPGIWLFLGTKANGRQFLDFYLNLFFWPLFKFGAVSQTTDRFSLKYIFYLFYGTKLWFFFFLPSFLFSLIKTLKDKRFFFLVSAFIPYFLVLLATKEAGDWYLLPLYPILALMIGSFLIFLQEKIYPPKQGVFLLVGLCLSLALIQNIYFRSLFIVSETLNHEVELSRLAKNISSPNETLIVDDFYFPVASFYSERKIKVVRREATDTNLVLSKNSFYKLLMRKDKVIILTTPEKFLEIKKDLKEVNFKIEKQAGDHLLITKI